MHYPLFFLFAGMTIAVEGGVSVRASPNRPASDADLEPPLGQCQLIAFEGEGARGAGSRVGSSGGITRRTVILSETRCNAAGPGSRCPTGEYCDGSSGKWLCARVVYERRPSTANLKCPSGTAECYGQSGCCPQGTSCTSDGNCNMACKPTDPPCGDGCCPVALNLTCNNSTGKCLAPLNSSSTSTSPLPSNTSSAISQTFLSSVHLVWSSLGILLMWAALPR